MGKIKVFHVINSLAVGGMENVLVSLVNRLDQDIFDHEICCISGSGPMQQRLRSGIKVHLMGKDAAADRLMPWKISRLLHRTRPDLVHTHNWGGIDGILATRLAPSCRRIPVVHAEHGRDALDPEGKNRKRNMARKLMSPMVAKFVAVSADLDSWLVHQLKIPAGKVLQIVNGVDTNVFSPGAGENLRAKLSLAPKDIAVGFVGRLDPVKDIGTLIKAVLRLGEPFRLIITGEGPERERLTRIAAGSDRIIFLGERQDVAAIYQAVDIFALPSIAEGTPCTVQEAMACGRPIVATRVGGVPSLVAEGINGFLFTPRDIDGLADCLALYLDNPDLRKDHGNNSRRRAVQEFSLDQMTRSYQSLYLELAGN